jgi:hypothetical protein
MSTQHTPCHPPHTYPRGMARRLRFDRAVYRFPLSPPGCLLACLYLLGQDACAICIFTSARLTYRPLHACLCSTRLRSLKMGRLDIFMLFAGLTTQQSASQPLYSLVFLYQAAPDSPLTGRLQGKVPGSECSVLTLPRDAARGLGTWHLRRRAQARQLPCRETSAMTPARVLIQRGADRPRGWNSAAPCPDATSGEPTDHLPPQDIAPFHSSSVRRAGCPRPSGRSVGRSVSQSVSRGELS